MRRRMEIFPIKFAAFRLAFLSLSVFACATAKGLTAIDDSTTTLPNVPVTMAVLTNDLVSISNLTATLRVTQPAHGRVVINSAPAMTDELTPLFQFAAVQLSN